MLTSLAENGLCLKFSIRAFQVTQIRDFVTAANVELGEDEVSECAGEV